MNPTPHANMLLREITPPPFELELGSAVEWLNQLPIANTLECSRRLFPVVQALNTYPMEPRLRFEILEQYRTFIFGVTRGLLPLFIDKPFPLDGKTRKIASLTTRFHLETAQGYQQLADDVSFEELFSEAECTLILNRAMEHLAHSLLRSSQLYEAPSSSVWATVARFYRRAEDHGWLDATVKADRNTPETIRGWHSRMLLFDMAAPGLLRQSEMQRLFDLLGIHGRALEDFGGAGTPQSRTGFAFDPENHGGLTPIAANSSPPPQLRCFAVEKLIKALHGELRFGGKPESAALRQALARMGGRLLCEDKVMGRRAQLIPGLQAIETSLKAIETRRLKSAQDADFWPDLNDLSLSPVDNPLGVNPREAKRIPRRKIRAFDGPAKDLRTVEVIPSETSGFYLIDSGPVTFKVGFPLGLNTDDQWIQIAVVRNAQIRDGRFWLGVELLGNEPRAVRVRSQHVVTPVCHGFLLEEDGTGTRLVVPPVKWPCGETVLVEWLEDRRLYRIAQLLERTGEFCLFRLIEAGPAAIKA
jgi:hypothetical protein